MLMVEMTIDIAGALLLFSFFMVCFFDKITEKKKSRALLYVLVSSILYIFSNIFVNICNIVGFSSTIKKVAVSIYPILGNLISFFGMNYLVKTVPMSHKNEKRIQIYNRVMLIVSELTILTLSPTKLLYYYDAMGKYVRGPLFALTYLLVFVGITVNIIILLCITSETKYVMSFSLFFTVPIISGVMQFVMPSTMSYNDSGILLACYLVFLTVYLEQRRQALEKEIELSESKVQIMTSQIKPHFVYNTLSVIAGLCDFDHEKAQELTVKFSNYLRHNLDYSKMKKMNPFEEELAHTKLYLDIEKERFGDRINVIYDISATDFYLPPLSLQPVVENAVKHGITKKEDGGTIKITSKFDGEYYTVSVEDDGVGFDSTKLNDKNFGHIGIKAVTTRLIEQLGAEITVKSEIGVGTYAGCRFKGKGK